MTIYIDITDKRVKKDKDGSCMVNFNYVKTDHLGAKSAGTGAFAVSAEDGIDSALHANLKYKLGFGSFVLNPVQQPRQKLGVAR